MQIHQINLINQSFDIIIGFSSIIYVRDCLNLETLCIMFGYFRSKFELCTNANSLLNKRFEHYKENL